MPFQVSAENSLAKPKKSAWSVPSLRTALGKLRAPSANFGARRKEKQQAERQTDNLQDTDRKTDKKQTKKDKRRDGQSGSEKIVVTADVERGQNETDRQTEGKKKKDSDIDIDATNPFYEEIMRGEKWPTTEALELRETDENGQRDKQRDGQSGENRVTQTDTETNV